MESAVASEEEDSELLCCWSFGVWSCCLAAAKARRVWRKEETATRARAGGNHSRVWSRISDPLAGWRERARQDMVGSDQAQI